jgi:hypothetical protein
MFGKHDLFKLVGAIVVATAIAVLGARTAKAGNPYNPGAYVYGGASQTVAQSIQSAGFGGARLPSLVHRRAMAAHHRAMA